MFANAKIFNDDASVVYKDTISMETVFDAKVAEATGQPIAKIEPSANNGFQQQQQQQQQSQPLHQQQQQQYTYPHQSSMPQQQNAVKTAADSDDDDDEDEDED